jgi:beta-mannanase
MVWKKVFHGMEKTGLDFPWHGKNPEPFSTLWKTFFHTMEKVGVASARAGGLIGGR